MIDGKCRQRAKQERDGEDVGFHGKRQVNPTLFVAEFFNDNSFTVAIGRSKINHDGVAFDNRGPGVVACDVVVGLRIEPCGKSLEVVHASQ